MNNFRKSISGRPGSNIPRPSSAISSSSNLNPGGGGGGSGGGGGGMLHSTRNVQETYHFPPLKPQAIVSCMADVQVPCTEDDLARPTPQKVMVVYEAFMDVATGCVRDDCYLDDIQEMKIVQHPDFVVDGVRFYIFLQQLASMMHDVGVYDFTSRDLTKPEADRVRRILSAVINFAKFREDRQPAFFQEMQNTDEVIDMIVDREKEYEQMTQELENLKQRRIAQEPRVEELKVINQNLASEMEVYKKKEVETTHLKDEVTKERSLLVERNRELNAAIEKSTKELDVLQAQRVHVPETLEQDLVQIPESLISLNAQIEQYRRQVQTKYSSVERIESVPRELYAIREMMAVTLSLLEKYHQGADELEALKSTIENRKLTDMTLSSKLEQTERLTRNLEEKNRVLRETMQQKRDQHEAEVLSQDKALAEAEARLLESRRLVEERRKKQAEIWQREEKYAQEVTAQMENLKHQFECYSTEIVQALRIN
ncbi:Nuf2 family-domain-containing protein [Linnemannia elongata]|uniref:Nuf2-domain-containing protein n=1 Tax=Linnemannia elongata AG-77 TaxID=1314771 RepID=A0A197JFT1_9FUNG|nr:kinetochore-associated Ndc80 complex subunit nuf2 [Linnemannia elongata]KAG0074476.1 kinetochore-associated Ndc80 complex subunit nuf2 [Linnemannia elongata]KAH7055165.1 Nuf2 family-domain-containing protein [Linnemannia elongata]KAK5807850.1 Nuf2 family-domain-containing protein [Linnemannia elongata]OAQ23858.1 Nuf2-domain-containing protein [Linnemannia elongata AG-77]